VMSLISTQQRLHDKWFMSPLKVTHLEMSRVNEDFVLHSLAEHLKKESSLRVIQIELVGLITSAKDCRQFMCTSVDAIAVLVPTDSQGRQDGHPFLCMVEIKTRTSDEVVRGLTQKFSDKSHCMIRMDSLEAKEQLNKWVPENRYKAQLAQHAIVPEVDDVLYVEATQHEIIMSCHLHYPQEYRDAISAAVHEPINELFIKPIHDLFEKKKAEPTFLIMGNLEIEPKYATDDVTYWFNYWMRQELLRHVPLDPAKAIIPALIAMWNILKGGVDVFSRLIGNVQPKHQAMPMHARIFLRFFMTQLMNGHLCCRLNDVFGKSTEAHITREFSTIKEVRAKLNNKSSFKDFLRHLYRNWDHLTEDIRRRYTNSNSSDSSPTVTMQKPLSPINTVFFSSRARWDDGDYTYIRTKDPSKHHRVHISQVLKTTTMVRRRCIVCCRICGIDDERGQPKQSDRSGRQGNRTVYCCVRCAETAVDDYQKQGGATCVDSETFVAICKNCWNLHHSEARYPQCEHTTPKKPEKRRRTGPLNRMNSDANLMSESDGSEDKENGYEELYYN
jgi:hypothetical protein